MNRHRRRTIPSPGADPAKSNIARASSRQVHRYSLGLRVVSSKGRIARKRKKYILNTERATYRDLIHAVAQDLLEQRVSTRKGNAK